MKLLSGNPDDFDFVFEFKNSSKEDNRLTICCPLYHAAWLNLVSNQGHFLVKVSLSINRFYSRIPS